MFKLLCYGEFFIAMLIIVNKRSLHQAILARDIIDMARDNSTNPDILEYIDSICWELFIIFGEEPHKVIEWGTLSSAYDHQYTALRAGADANDLSDVDAIYSKATQIIANN
jgi:hypothetical protein